MRELLRFGMVGAIGFVIDAGLLVTFVNLGAKPLTARLASFLAAATVTYLLNRRFTFRADTDDVWLRWLGYVALTALGASINVGTYQFWIARYGASALQLVVGTALGSLVAMSINFVLSKWIVFRPVVQARG